MVRWTVDDRRMSLWTRVYVLGMRLRRDKSAFEGSEHTLAAARERQRAGNAPPTRWTRLARRVAAERVEGMTVWRVRPRRGTPRVRVLYLHGGGYVHPLSADYWRLVRALTRGAVEVALPAYPLAPEATVDDVLPALARLARSWDDGLPLVLMGDSAGGALAIALAREVPGARLVVALSPWLDATLGDAEVAELEATDPMLAESGLREAGRWWARPHSPLDPRVSVVEGSLLGLPPLHVFIGDRDILRPAVDELADRARREDADLHVHEVTAMFHVWMTRAVPEARRTRRELRHLVTNGTDWAPAV
jgi:acetyl esterase/lipase